MQKILITGFGGFIGYNLVQRMREKYQIVTFDNFSGVSNYAIKVARAQKLGVHDFTTFKNQKSLHLDQVSFHYADLCNIEDLDKIFSSASFDLVIHLAALVGVRQSLLQPQAYIDSNVKGFVNLLECAKKHSVKNIVYASSSSIYGLNEDTPYTEDQM